MYDVVIVGSPNVNAGYTLVGNAQYPAIAQDVEKISFAQRAAMRHLPRRHSGLRVNRD